MAVITQESAGGVVYRRAQDRIQICLILDPYGYWTLPKGKIEAGETAEAAALREVGEEVGLRDLRLVGYVGDAAYRYRAGPDLVKKRVRWYLMEAPSAAKPRAQRAERVQDAGWFEPEAALKMVGYRTVKSALRRAFAMLGEHGVGDAG